MPIVDMPVKELEAYLGSSPKPADFDAYWAKALADLDAQGLLVKVKCEDHFQWSLCLPYIHSVPLWQARAFPHRLEGAISFPNCCMQYHILYS